MEIVKREEFVVRCSCLINQQVFMVKKAFNTVNHDILIENLNFKGDNCQASTSFK